MSMSKAFEPADFLFGPLEENEDDEDEDFILEDESFSLAQALNQDDALGEKESDSPDKIALRTRTRLKNPLKDVDIEDLLKSLPDEPEIDKVFRSRKKRPRKKDQELENDYLRFLQGDDIPENAEDDEEYVDEDGDGTDPEEYRPGRISKEEIRLLQIDIPPVPPDVPTPAAHRRSSPTLLTDQHSSSDELNVSENPRGDDDSPKKRPLITEQHRQKIRMQAARCVQLSMQIVALGSAFLKQYKLHYDLQYEEKRKLLMKEVKESVHHSRDSLKRFGQFILHRQNYLPQGESFILSTPLSEAFIANKYQTGNDLNEMDRLYGSHFEKEWLVENKQLRLSEMRMRVIYTPAEVELLEFAIRYSTRDSIDPKTGQRKAGRRIIWEEVQREYLPTKTIQSLKVRNKNNKRRKCKSKPNQSSEDKKLKEKKKGNTVGGAGGGHWTFPLYPEEINWVIGTLDAHNNDLNAVVMAAGYLRDPVKAYLLQRMGNMTKADAVKLKRELQGELLKLARRNTQKPAPTRTKRRANTILQQAITSVTPQTQPSALIAMAYPNIVTAQLQPTSTQPTMTMTNSAQPTASQTPTTTIPIPPLAQAHPLISTTQIATAAHPQMPTATAYPSVLAAHPQMTTGTTQSQMAAVTPAQMATAQQHFQRIGRGVVKDVIVPPSVVVSRVGTQPSSAHRKGEQTGYLGHVGVVPLIADPREKGSSMRVDNDIGHTRGTDLSDLSDNQPIMPRGTNVSRAKGTLASKNNGRNSTGAQRKMPPRKAKQGKTSVSDNVEGKFKSITSSETYIEGSNASPTDFSQLNIPRASVLNLSAGGILENSSLSRDALNGPENSDSVGLGVLDGGGKPFPPAFKINGKVHEDSRSMGFAFLDESSRLFSSAFKAGEKKKVGNSDKSIQGVDTQDERSKLFPFAFKSGQQKEATEFIGYCGSEGSNSGLPLQSERSKLFSSGFKSLNAVTNSIGIGAVTSEHSSSGMGIFDERSKLFSSAYESTATRPGKDSIPKASVTNNGTSNKDFGINGTFPSEINIPSDKGHSKGTSDKPVIPLSKNSGKELVTNQYPKTSSGEVRNQSKTVETQKDSPMLKESSFKKNTTSSNSRIGNVFGHGFQKESRNSRNTLEIKNGSNCVSNEVGQMFKEATAEQSIVPQRDNSISMQILLNDASIPSVSRKKERLPTKDFSVTAMSPGHSRMSLGASLLSPSRPPKSSALTSSPQISSRISRRLLDSPERLLDGNSRSLRIIPRKGNSKDSSCISIESLQARDANISEKHVGNEKLVDTSSMFPGIPMMERSISYTEEEVTTKELLKIQARDEKDSEDGEHVPSKRQEVVMQYANSPPSAPAASAPPAPSAAPAPAAPVSLAAPVSPVSPAAPVEEKLSSDTFEPRWNRNDDKAIIASVRKFGADPSKWPSEDLKVADLLSRRSCESMKIRVQFLKKVASKRRRKSGGKPQEERKSKVAKPS